MTLQLLIEKKFLCSYQRISIEENILLFQTLHCKIKQINNQHVEVKLSVNNYNGALFELRKWFLAVNLTNAF